MHLTLALSISGSINKTAVIVAAASLLGVALLALLFFAQAREVKRLREWVSAGAEREAQLEARILAGVRAQQARAAQQRARSAAATPSAQPLVSSGASQAPATTSTTRIAEVGDAASSSMQPTVAGAAVPGLPVAGEAPRLAAGAPAPVAPAAGAPAAGAPAARARAAGASAAVPPAAAEVPAADLPAPPASPAPPAAAPAIAAAGAPAAAAAMSSAAAASVASAPAPSAAAAASAVPAVRSASGASSSAPAAPSPSVAGASSRGAVEPPPVSGPPADGVVSVSPQPATEAGASSRPARPPAPPAPVATQRAASVTQEPRAGRRTVDVGGAASERSSETRSASRPVGDRATIYRKERSPQRTVGMALGGLVLLVLVVVLLVSVVSSGGSSPNAASRTAASHRSTTANVALDKGALDVAVLNATETNGLAAQVAGKLKGRGYSHARALYGTPSGSYPVTTVQYAKGFRSAALAVAHVVEVPAAEVLPLESSAQPLAAGASVVVIVGQAAAGGEATESEGGEAETGEGLESVEGAEGAEETSYGTEGTEETAYGGEVPPESQTAEEGA